MEGFLLIWTNYLYGWKKKYFVLQGNILAYSSDKNKSQQSLINLDQAQISVHKNPKRFMIISLNSILHLKALTVPESRTWIEKLNITKADCSKDSSWLETEIITEDKISGPKPVSLKINKLWSLHEKIELVSKQLMINNKENSEVYSLLLSSTTEFKNLALDTLNLLEDQEKQLEKWKAEIDSKQNQEIEPIFRSARDTMDEFCMDRLSELSNNSQASLFVDAKSTLSEEANEEQKIFTWNAQNLFYRKSLPYLRNPNQKVNVWKSIKDYVKKDLTKIPVPLTFHEPLSLLQRLSEDMTYNELLIKASTENDHLMRLALVACFSISCYASTANRIMKPFSPLVGETFDLEKDGFSYLAEQISFQPSTSAWHCQHKNYCYSGWTQITHKFKGTYLKIIPKGTCELLLKKFNEKFVWKKIPVNVHHILLGNIYLDHFGSYECINLTKNTKAVINIKKKTWFNQKKHYVEGVVLDSFGKTKYKIIGKWSENVIIKNESNGEETLGYTIHPYPTGFEDNYFFTEFAMQLNIPPEFAIGISNTDSRHRPDIRAMENGDIETAEKIKNFLEETQNSENQGKWFISEENDWKYAGDYWEQKSANNLLTDKNIFAYL